jgi:hypothetical protein
LPKQEERAYTFTLFDKTEATDSQQEDEGEESLFAEDDEYETVS